MKIKVLLSISDKLLKLLDKKVESLGVGATRSGYIESLIREDFKKNG